MLITTTDTLQGVEIKEYIGPVYAYALDITGGLGKMGDKQMELAMGKLFDALQAAGEKAGADAVIGVKFILDSHIIRGIGTGIKL